MKWGNKHHYIIHATGIAGILILLVLKIFYSNRSTYKEHVSGQIADSFREYCDNDIVKVEQVKEDTLRRTVKQEVQLLRSSAEKTTGPQPYDPHTAYKVELNTADSAELVKLYGIGQYYATRILQYREKLGGFAIPEQLLEIPGIDRERLTGFYENVFADSTFIRKMDIKTAEEDQLAGHLYIGRYLARCIIRYRETVGADSCTLENLLRDNILSNEQARKIGWYLH